MCLPFVFDRLLEQRHKVLCNMASPSNQVIKLLLIFVHLCLVVTTMTSEAASCQYFQICGLYLLYWNRVTLL